MQLGDVLKQDKTPNGFPWTTVDSASRCRHLRQFSINLRVIACVLFLCYTILRVNQIKPVALPAMGWMGMSLLTFHPLTHTFFSKYHDTEHAKFLTFEAVNCLLYTSDAADDLTRVDLGGRRII